MLQQRRMKNSMSEMEERKKQARKEREKQASALATNLSCQYLDDLKFNLQPRQTGDKVLTNTIIKRALGEFHSFARVLRVKESHLYLGLDNTVPGTPEVNDVDFESPLNGMSNDIFSRAGKNGTNNHVPDIKKLENVRNKSSRDFAEPKGKAEPPKVSKPVSKPKPPKLEVRKPSMQGMIKNPNNIESILKEMTQPLPPALTDIETPGKGTSKMFRFPQQETLQPLPDNVLDEKPTENGGTSQEKEDSTVKLEPFPDVVDSSNSFKKVESGKTRIPPVKTNDSGGAKTKASRKISTSSATSSSDDSSSDSSGSSDSENEKVVKQKKIAAKKTSAINSPLNQYSPSSKMHKTKSPFNNNYIPNNKENNIHPGLPIGAYATDINLKQKSNDGFPYNNSSDLILNDVVQVVTEDSSLMVSNSSLFPSPIGKTISPLDSDNLFSDLIDIPGPNFLDDEFFSKNDDDFSTVTTENPVNSRVKPQTNHDDYKDPLDDSFESNNPTNLKLNKRVTKYKKDTKDNEKKPSTDERNKSSSKSNETKDKSKSKSTRTDSGPSMKVNSGSKGHPVRTKAELKCIPKQRRKSISESSDDNKSRKSKDSFKKGSSSEKELKKEKKDRLKPKVSREMKDVVSIEDKNSPSDKKPSSIMSSTPTKPIPISSSNSYIPTTDTLLPSSKSPISSLSQAFNSHLTNPMSSVENDITSVIPPLKSPNGYTVADLKVEEDKCDLFLDDKHETGNIFDTIKKSMANRISPLISPVCYPHGRDLMDDGTFDDPSAHGHDEMKLEDDKDDNDVIGYESPLRFHQDLLTAVELKPSPVHTAMEEEKPINATMDVSVNPSVNDMDFVSPRNNSVNDFNNFITRPSSSVMDSNFHSQSNSLVNSISLAHENTSLDNLDFSCPDNTSINTTNFSSEVHSSSNKINFTPGSSSRNTFCTQGNDLRLSSQSSDQLNVGDIPSTYPPILIDEMNTEPSNLLVNSQDIKPENTELLIDLDPYSVKDINNIVPVSITERTPGNVNVDILPSEDTHILPVSTLNDTNPPKLTIKIPLHKLKNKYKKHNTCNDVRSTVFDSSLSSGLDEDLEIDVENIGSPLKRKRRVHSNSICNIEDSTNKKDLNKRIDCEFETPNKEQYEKLIVSISLAKLKRAPFKGASSGDKSSKEKRSPKVRPAKICKLNSEPQVDVVTTDVLNEDVVMREESPAPFVNSNNSPPSIPSSSPSIKNEEMETENGHQNDVSQHDISLEKDTKRRSRSRKEKNSSKSEAKPDVKETKNSETIENKSCEISDDVCRECGTLRKDYGRDSRRINCYKTTYREYFNEGSRRKHEADNSKIPTERAHKYIEAVLKYVQYLIGLELARKMNELPGVEEYMQITSECIQLVDYVITKYGRKENSASPSYDVRFTLLCFRLQSILYLKLFKVKKESAMKYSKVLSRYFKQYKAGHNGPTPYPKPGHNRGSTGTPSPSSPSPGPSPGGSVASVGSAGSSGSTGSNDITTNGVGPYVTIPTDVHEKAFQHLQYSRNLLHGHLLWEDSELYASQCQPFLIKVSRRAGQLTMQSSMLHVVDYVTAGLEIIKELPPS